MGYGIPSDGGSLFQARRGYDVATPPANEKTSEDQEHWMERMGNQLLRERADKQVPPKDYTPNQS